MLKISTLVLAVLLAIVVCFAFYKEIKPISFGLHSPVYQSGGRALGGFDVVSYFRGRPVMGSNVYFVKWMEVNWEFANKENLDTFMKNPEKYAPQFGGYCSKAVSTGFTAPGNPGIYVVWNDKLYIFAGEESKKEFLANPQSIIAACEQHWN